MAKRRAVKQYRQGDVFVAQAKAAEGEPVPAQDGRLILAAGEVTGHHHAVPSAEAAMVAKGAERFLRVPKLTTLAHEEHGPIQLPGGTYEVTIQREYHPESIRNVLD
jgi:hypothetical protein